MPIFKKDMYLVLTKYYLPIILYLMILLITRDYVNADYKAAQFVNQNPGIRIITANSLFNLSNIVFIYVFLGNRIPTKLFESESGLRESLLTTPMKNTYILWSKIMTTFIVMIPFLLLSLFALNSMSVGVFTVTLLIGGIVINIVSISSFIKNKMLSMLVNLVITIIILSVSLTDNYLINNLNKELSYCLKTGVFPTKLVMFMTALLAVVSVFTTICYKFLIKRSRING